VLQCHRQLLIRRLNTTPKRENQSMLQSSAPDVALMVFPQIVNNPQLQLCVIDVLERLELLVSRRPAESFSANS
jgi:hypothetical protein